MTLISCRKRRDTSRETRLAKSHPHYAYIFTRHSAQRIGRVGEASIPSIVLVKWFSASIVCAYTILSSRPVLQRLEPVQDRLQNHRIGPLHDSGPLGAWCLSIVVVGTGNGPISTPFVIIAVARLASSSNCRPQSPSRISRL